VKPPPPTVLSLVVSERIHQDRLGLAYILGVFHTYHANRFPATIPHASVYLALTDARGTLRLTLRLVDGEDEDAAPLVRQSFDATIPSPLEVATISIDFDSIHVPAPGVYRWQLLYGEEIIADQRLNVVQN